jgi:FkbH-like protein
MSAQLDELLNGLDSDQIQLADLLRSLDEIEKSAKFEKTFSIGLSANISTDLIGTYLRKQIVRNRLQPVVVHGNFDSHFDNLKEFSAKGLDCALILPLLDNVVPGLESRLPTLSLDESLQIQGKIREELSLALREARGLKRIFIGKFHYIFPSDLASEGDRSRARLQGFNQVLADLAEEFPNVALVEMDAILGELGRSVSVMHRFYFRFKAPYTGIFCNELAKVVLSMSRGGGTYFYKALVLDCDNTLWGGIIGEDLLANIKLEPHDYPGSVFWRIQNDILTLQKAGVIICLCSKNNPADVDEVLEKHNSMLLKDDHIVIKKVNWEPKVQNIQAIARELNIGLDSIVFVDDSDFECQAVRSQLPSVQVFQVPKNAFEYPAVMNAIKRLFLSGGNSGESAAKTAQYKQRALAEQAKQSFENHDDYLKSLELKIELRKNHVEQIKRISELTQKSNQFNLTTRRYSEAELLSMIATGGTDVFSIRVSDKFGDHGITGVAVFRYEGEECFVDSFLMSCRVIGRGVEVSVWQYMFEEARKKGCCRLRAEFRKSAKNAQVEMFYEDLGLGSAKSDGDVKTYLSGLNEIKLAPQNHAEVRYVV